MLTTTYSRQHKNTAATSASSRPSSGALPNAVLYSPKETSYHCPFTLVPNFAYLAAITNLCFFCTNTLALSASTTAVVAG
jgi:hypothetical protein